MEIRVKKRSLYIFSSSLAKEIAALRQLDGDLLKTLKIRYIFDLMNEVTYISKGISLCSSEASSDDFVKNSNIHVLQMPYPGVEFFQSVNESNFFSDTFSKNSSSFKDIPADRKGNLIPSWEAAQRQFAMESVFSAVRHDFNDTDVDFKDLPKWSIFELTLRYFSIFQHLVREVLQGEACLIHCVSGWDRTPFWVGIMRLYLWSTGKILTKLNAKEVVYLVVGYDWLLFGHNLMGRLKHGQDIFSFFIFFARYLEANNAFGDTKDIRSAVKLLWRMYGDIVLPHVPKTQKKEG
eukprot:TRINITY_DN10706_c0_g2_i1.p1 TRINITY_DN10706_c0_g2~~TRINITY_DN10706_c0_g2_i1.p1  ORF type:complete len:321 (-),score=51.89 TRINITY_DN10706_c0_g2_i1:192-1070(-)